METWAQGRFYAEAGGYAAPRFKLCHKFFGGSIELHQVRACHSLKLVMTFFAHQMFS